MAVETSTVTLLFTDIEGSTRLWEEQREAMRTALARHDAILSDAITQQGGTVFKTMGDAFYAVFPLPHTAVHAAVDAQRILLAETSLRVRMALHTGAVESRENDYFGQPLNRTARLLAVGHGGQVLLSDATQALIFSSLPTGVSLQDLGRHPLKDLPEPARIWQVCHPDLPNTFPALRTAPTQVQLLPHALTVFIGREQEAEAAERLLRRPEVRLVTLTGFGGMGKTRLAQEVAQRCLLAFPDGVWWLGMEEIVSVGDMFARILERMRLPIQNERSVVEQLRQVLREKSVLLVLDNLEQIADVATALRDLLTGTAALKCLVTSRRALELRGEHILELAPLPATEAETLFVTRVQEANADFAVTDANREDIARLCRGLEGVPLAIELAAARGSILTPRQMLERLNERFRLLQSRTPDLPPRQRALSAAIDWSYCLLGEEAQATLAQISVFAGGFTLEDAEAVYDAFDVLESLEELRRHSFFRVQTDGALQQTRFLLLESLREYALGKLAAFSDTGHAIRQKHADYFWQRTRERLQFLRTPQEGNALQQMNLDYLNLRAAFEWTGEAGLSLRHAELALVLSIFLLRRGSPQEACGPIESGLAALQPQQTTHPVLYAALLRESAGRHFDQFEWESARIAAGQALVLFEAIDDAQQCALTCNVLGEIARKQQDFTQARDYFRQALDYLERQNAVIETAIVQNNLGLVEILAPDGSQEEAARHLQQALLIRRAQGDRRGLAETLNSLGMLAYEQQNWQDAWNYYAESLLYHQELRHTLNVGVALFNLGEIAEEWNQQAQARSETQTATMEGNRACRLFAAAEALLEEGSSPHLQMVVEKLERAISASGYSEADAVTLRQSMKNQPLDVIITRAISISEAL